LKPGVENISGFFFYISIILFNKVLQYNFLNAYLLFVTADAKHQSIL